MSYELTPQVSPVSSTNVPPMPSLELKHPFLGSDLLYLPKVRISSYELNCVLQKGMLQS